MVFTEGLKTSRWKPYFPLKPCTVLTSSTRPLAIPLKPVAIVAYGKSSEVSDRVSAGIGYPLPVFRCPEKRHRLPPL